MIDNDPGFTFPQDHTEVTEVEFTIGFDHFSCNDVLFFLETDGQKHPFKLIVPDSSLVKLVQFANQVKDGHYPQMTFWGYPGTDIAVLPIENGGSKVNFIFKQKDNYVDQKFAFRVDRLALFEKFRSALKAVADTGAVGQMHLYWCDQMLCSGEDVFADEMAARFQEEIVAGRRQNTDKDEMEFETKYRRENVTLLDNQAEHTEQYARMLLTMKIPEDWL
nr:hypothetical protein [uncultured Cohaesibacter sp.]